MYRRVDIFWVLRYTAGIFACLVRAFPREEIQRNLYAVTLADVDVTCCLAKNQNVSSHKQISLGELFRHRGFIVYFKTNEFFMSCTSWGNLMASATCETPRVFFRWKCVHAKAILINAICQIQGITASSVSDHMLCHSSTDLCINCLRSAVKQSGHLFREKYCMCHVPM